jgi:F-type H+-transporting ATPase subunit b
MRLALMCRLCVLALFAVLLFSAPALAADAHGHSGGEKPGMLDKLEFTGIKRWDLGLYTLIVFGLLMLILSKYAWPHIKKGLEQREAKIIGAIEQARQDAAVAKTELEAARKELAKAAQEARAILDEARKDADALKLAKVEEGTKEAQAERDRAKREVETRMEVMKKELIQEVAELAALMATKALRRQVTLENQRELLDESLAELKATVNNRA